MSYETIYSDEAFKNLKDLDKKEAQRIKKKLEKVKENPLNFLKRLKGVELYSLRVGKYRLILSIEFSTKKIIIIRIGSRKNVYDKLS